MTELANAIQRKLLAGKENEIISIFGEDENNELPIEKIPQELPVLSLRNAVLFPGVVIPIAVGRSKSLELIQQIYTGNKTLGTVSQIDAEIEDPTVSDLNKIGTIARIIKILEMPDDSITVIIQGKQRFEIERFVSTEPFFTVVPRILNDTVPNVDEEFEAIAGSIKELALNIINLSNHIPPEASFALRNIVNISFLINYISSNSEIASSKKQQLLEVSDLRVRAQKLLEYLTVELQRLELQSDIQSKVKVEIDQQQREYLLNQQMKTIRNELGDNNEEEVEVEELRKRAKKMKWSNKTHEIFKRELKKLERINPASPEYSNQHNYLDIMLELPWEIYTKDNFDMKRAQKILDEDHFGLEKVKDRILEHLAVLKLKGDLKAPILCLVGPPGVGKTSLGKSVARALKRKYMRMSLGGLHDESEIRGHRKTYIGAMPGRIIQGLKKVKSSNPVFVLDEIDKIGSDFRGNPAFALLEVLDPEQNTNFHDNYLEIEYDLSKVLFIATANTLSTINLALLDRMEIIDVSGYIVEEKTEIAIRHLIPKQLENHGVRKSQLRFNEEVLHKIITGYTRESGVRELDKQIAKITRVTARQIAMEEKRTPKLTKESVQTILGAPRFINSEYQDNQHAGVVTGLAWTAVGGQILFIESSLSRGKGGLTTTGNLGEVMKESVMLALEYLKAHAQKLDINSELFDKWNVHLHVPAGAIPKDGPSAGISMVTSLASLFTQRKVKSHIAMTGEITLRGKVLPVGGIKEKILAAKRANITEIILSEENKKDIEEINDKYINGLTFKFVNTIMEVLEVALLKEKVENAVKFGL